ncbi:cell cycle checkpoint protein RAD1 [Nasonia vitripennis]|uniref:Cell cycle checkpoint protein RAD1 n=1 Tax=Nasonia vitripennis TaxID=7425 RepID=A0A7M7M6K0_NASVI|nr:cell cycle checkpoint protein RAD1 [Nasonia vitripennis]XP_031782351.1 cell cycle checkpoint protein RAD1 [Nasonia vitripennis]
MTTDYVFVAKLANLKTVIQLLRSVNFKDSATCYGSQNGLKLTVEEAKCMQASAYLPKALFEQFIISEDFLFRINISILVECLSMFWTSINSQGSTVALEMQYKGVGHPVTVLIEEDGVIVDCSLKTQEPDEILDFDLHPSTVVNKVLLHSELLKDVLSELDPSCNHLELFLSPNSPYFMISTRGTASEVQVELPHNTEMIETFQCNKEAKSKYLLPHIKPAMKAMSCSNKVSLRTNEAGLLCFQYMLKTDEGVNCFIEYYISPLVDDDDDNE